MTNFKDQCVSCDMKITVDENYYNSFGNYCRTCNFYADRLQDIKRKIRVFEGRKLKGSLSKDDRYALKYYENEKSKIISKLPNYCDLDFEKLYEQLDKKRKDSGSTQSDIITEK
jgi:hypothetical protein